MADSYRDTVHSWLDDAAAMGSPDRIVQGLATLARGLRPDLADFYDRTDARDLSDLDLSSEDFDSLVLAGLCRALAIIQRKRGSIGGPLGASALERMSEQVVDQPWCDVSRGEVHLAARRRAGTS